MSVFSDSYLDFVQGSCLIDVRTLRAADFPLHLPGSSLRICAACEGQARFRIQDADFTLSAGKLVFINTQASADLVGGSADLLLRVVSIKNRYFRPDVLAKLAAYPLFQSFIYSKQKESRRLCSHLSCEKLPLGFLPLLDLMELFWKEQLLHAQEELFYPLLAVFDKLRPNDFRVYRDKQPPYRDVVSVKVQDILRYVEEHYQTASLSELAERYHYSPNYLSNMIRLHSGATFGQHLSRRRLSVARELLENSALDVGEIIQRVGYSDKSSFYRQFNRSFGCTPSELRERRPADAEEKKEKNTGSLTALKKMSRGAF